MTFCDLQKQPKGPLDSAGLTKSLSIIVIEIINGNIGYSVTAKDADKET